jgi:hypothetical protein
VNTYKITYSVGTSRHDEQRYVKTVQRHTIGAVFALANIINTRPNTTIVSVKAA